MSNDQYRFDYLKDKAANPMFKHMADFIKKQKCRKILDLGSGYSRINEFMGAYKYQLTAVDNDSHVIEYLNETYGEKENIDVVEADAISFVDSIGIDGVDCVVISGFLYYMKPYVFKYNPEDYIDKIVEKYNPKYILVCDPRPSIPYVSPDYEQLFSDWTYEAKFFNLDIRMGERVVYALHTDKKRSIYDREIGAEFNENSEYNHQKEPDFTDKELYNTVYVTNTETLDDIDPYVATHYVSVCGGLKGLYQARMDWVPGRKFKMTYVDVVPSALDFKMYFDHMYPIHKSIPRVAELYKEEINPDVHFSFGEYRMLDETDIILQEQLEYLGIEENWDQFIKEYAKAEKTYIRIDAVNDIDLLNTILKRDKKSTKLFWYSNIHDWHQFRYTEEQYQEWCDLLHKDNEIKLVGKVPPFTSS